MGSDKCIRFVAIAVLIVTLCHQTIGGSWRKLERKIHQDPRDSEQWDENRIIFPDIEDDSSEEEPEKSWRPTIKPLDEDARQLCINNCPTSREYDPVCGTNGITYQNMKILQCVMACGYPVDLHQPRPCVKITTSPPVTTTQRNVEQERCINSCPTTPEYNPVCGTNQVTYNNVGKLGCAKYCGVAVELLRQMPCSNQLVRATTETTTPPNVPGQETQDCIDSCPMTRRYDPVCGTNNVTYRNIGILECAKACGVDVVLRHLRPCRTNKFGPQSSEEDDESQIDPRLIVPEFRWQFKN